MLRRFLVFVATSGLALALAGCHVSIPRPPCILTGTCSPTPTPTPEVTPEPTATPTPVPSATPVPVCEIPPYCPCLGRLAISGTPHAVFERRIKLAEGTFETFPCHRYDLTPRFGTGGGGRGQACNSDHHSICSLDGNDSGPCYRHCEPPGDVESNRPSWTAYGARYTFVVGEWGYQFDVCGHEGESYTITVDRPVTGFLDGHGQPLHACGDVRDSRSGTF